MPSRPPVARNSQGSTFGAMFFAIHRPTPVARKAAYARTRRPTRAGGSTRGGPSVGMLAESLWVVMVIRALSISAVMNSASAVAGSVGAWQPERLRGDVVQHHFLGERRVAQ